MLSCQFMHIFVSYEALENCQGRKIPLSTCTGDIMRIVTSTAAMAHGK